MTKRIRKVSELPEWYDLANYSNAQMLDTAGWFEQFYVRREVLKYLFEYADEGSPLPFRFSELTSFIRAHPIVDVSAHPTLPFWFGGGPLPELKNQEPFYSRGVFPLTLVDLYKAEYLIEKEKRDYARKFYDDLFGLKDELRPMKYQTQDWMGEPVDNFLPDDRYANLKVNLQVSDEQLIKGFKQWLDSLRSKKRSAISLEKHAKPNFSEWVRLGVLPYLDLMIWAFETETKIPNRVLADAVFPPGEGGEEVIRKTTSKLALRLLNYSFSENLMAMAAYEIMERKHT